MGPGQAGDDLASTLFARHARSVRHYLWLVTGDTALAEDLSQDVFLQVVRAADRYEPRERERAWLFRIARNAVIDYRRRSAARPTSAGDPERLVQPATQALASDLSRAIAALPDTEREAFLMAEVGGLSYAEIAAALGLTLAAVRSAIYRARQMLRAALVPPAPMAPLMTVGDSRDD